MAVRGLSASNRASTSRLKPIAALRAATMQTAIQPTCAHENGCSRHASSAPVNANGSAKTEWLKRTNERYVVSLDIGIWDLTIEPPHRTWLDPAHQVFFHIVRAVGDAHRNQRRALARFDAPEFLAETERARPRQRGAFE